MSVIMLDQPATKSSGSTISGVTLPWILRKTGHFE